jgi:1-acyl-sn-glycerol-3-phosphate acyltransferase
MHPNRWAATAKLGDPGRPTPGFVRFAKRWLRPIVKAAYRPTLDGLERLPTDRPFMLVSNHSAGMSIAEILSFIVLYLDKVGPDRPLAGFAHPFGFHVYPASALLRGVGAIPSTYDAARDTLAKGVPLLVFPGGDYETLRPVWQANRVDFGGRKGFLRLARELRVPIVPMGIQGSHYTAPVLWRGRALSKVFLFPWLFGLKRYGLTLLGVGMATAIFLAVPLAWPLRAGLMWAALASPLAFWPIVPWTIHMRVGTPILPETLFDGGPADDAQLERALRHVQGAVQDLVTPGVDRHAAPSARAQVPASHDAAQASPK